MPGKSGSLPRRTHVSPCRNRVLPSSPESSRLGLGGVYIPQNEEYSDGQKRNLTCEVLLSQTLCQDRYLGFVGTLSL